MLTIDEMAHAVDGKFIQQPSVRVCRNILIDSRMIKKNDVYIAIIGHRLDGHKFISSAIKNGAAIVIVSKNVKVPEHITVIRVKDTTIALGQVAGHYRQKFDIPVIAVTGSVGKTSTKELIASVLRTQLKILKNERNFNNHIGVPLTLLKLRPGHEAAVLELGTNQPGDIDWLGKIVKPTIAVFTNIGEAHLEKLRNKSGVYREKAALIKHVDSDGKVIFNADDLLLRKLNRRGNKQKLIGFGFSETANVRAEYLLKRHRIEFKVYQKKYEIKALSRFQVYNALAAICCGQELNITYHNIYKALKKTVRVAGRMELKRFGKINLIDDSYNANPASFNAAVETLAAHQCLGRRFLICADMLELGKKSRMLHEKCGQFSARYNIDFILGLGQYSKFLITQARQSNRNLVTRHFSARGEMHQFINRNFKARDVALIKGSRSMNMEATVKYIASLSR